MKALKIARIVLVTVAAALIGLATIIDGTELGVLLAVMGGAWGLIMLLFFAVAGSIFLFSCNKVVKAIGVGLTVGVYACMLALMVAFSAYEILPTAVVVGLVGAIVYGVSWVFEIIRFAITHASRDDLEPDEDPKIAAIMKWRTLVDRKIITEEEFMVKRNAILGLGQEEVQE